MSQTHGVRDRLIVALDQPDLPRALAHVDRIGDSVLWYKVGLQLFCASGRDGVRAMADRGKKIFLDLKLHDIPATVEKAVSALKGLPVSLLTIHAAGGPAMIAAASKAAHSLKGDGGLAPRVLAVTMLTSLDGTEIPSLWNPGTTLEEKVLGLARPALFIERRGADQDPAPIPRESRSLKGAAAARIVRALCDWRPPVGVRELARRAATDPGYVTRILSLLANEGVIVRGEKGDVAEVRWQNLIRRWAQDYAVARTNRAKACLDPRGADALLDRLRVSKARFALTGSRAIPRAAQTAPARTTYCYVEDIDQASKRLGLREVEVGANVVLLEPFDAVIFERTRVEDGLTCVALSQCAVDLLTGSGREPSEATALVTWMEKHEDAWRT